MQNIITVIFKVESEGYQAITMLSQYPVTDNSAILQMALVKRTANGISVCDSFDSGAHTTDDTMHGGVIGGLIGILGGPIGVLLSGSTGALIGSVVDARDARNSASLIETVADKLQNGETALVALAEEVSESDLNLKLGKFDAEVLRYDAAVIAEEVEEAEKLQKEMERQARVQLRAAKKDERKKAIDEKRAKISADFEAFKAKFKK